MKTGWIKRLIFAVAAASVAVCLLAYELVCKAQRQEQGPPPPAPSAQQTTEKETGAESPDDAKALVDLAMIHFEKGEAAQGVPLLERALKFDEKTYGPDHIAITRSLSPLAFLKYVTGDYQSSEQLYTRMLDIYVKIGGPDNRYNSTPLMGLANVYKAKGDYARAEPLYQRVLAIEEKAGGLEHPMVAIILDSFADMYLQKRDYARAQPLLERAARIREKVFGEEHVLSILSFNKLAGMYDEQGDDEKAEQIYKRVLAIREKSQGAESPEVATALNNLALLYAARGDYARAEPLYQRALQIRELRLGAENPAVAKTLGDLATLHKERGDYARAEPLYQRSLAIYEKASGPESPNVATTLDNLAGLYSITGDFERAEQLRRRALAIREKVLGSEHPEIGDSLNNLAVLYEKKGDTAQAEQLYRRALAIIEKALGPDHPKVATALNNLASLYREMADYVSAEPLFERALRVREKALGAEHPDVANSLNSLGQLLFLKGDYKRAEQMFERALAIREKTIGPEHAETAAALSNLGLVYQEMKDYARAEKFFQRALRINEKAFGADHLSLTTQLNNLAVLAYEQGGFERAEQLTRRALLIHEKKMGLERPEAALLLNSLAALRDKRGAYAEAESLYLRAAEIMEKALGREHPMTADVLGNLALMYGVMGETEKAMTYLARTNEIREHNLALVLGTGSEQQKLLYMATVAGVTDYTVWFHQSRAPRDTQAARLALTTILRRKGRALDAMSDQIGALRRRLDPEDRALLEQLNRVSSELAALVLKGQGNTDAAKHRETVARLEAERERLQAAVSTRSAQFRAQSQPVTLEGVQAAIPPQAALVEMVSYRAFNEKARTRDARWGARRYAAYVLMREGEPRWVDLGAAESIDAQVTRLRVALSSPRNGQAKRIARALDQMLMRPVRQLLGGRSVLLISPDGMLNLVPFGALVDEQDRYLVERYTITYLTSGRDLLRLRIRAQESKQAPLIVADPSFDASGSTAAVSEVERSDGANRRSSDFTGAHFSPLPGTAGEAKALVALFPAAQLFTGARASETALKQASAPGLLHVATHGFFLKDRGNDHAGQLPPALNQNSLLRSDTIESENLLLRSGLALAGANERRGGAGEDGVLTALEAAQLNLWGTKLVVLSACETGVGEVRNGDGVYGLRRALVLAGAESQLMSLWQVSDAATKELMVEYYKRLQAGDGRAEALRRVQLQMLKSGRWSHPFFWASFIPIGNWESMDK
jgi:CHAT domain-containing protein/tetratricopeptide (TPR) repeat protein